MSRSLLARGFNHWSRRRTTRKNEQQTTRRTRTAGTGGRTGSSSSSWAWASTAAAGTSSVTAAALLLTVQQENDEQQKHHNQHGDNGFLKESGASSLIADRKLPLASSSSLHHFLMTTTLPSSITFSNTAVCRCADDNIDEFDQSHPDGYTEAERFYQGLEYHRALLFDYSRRWEQEGDDVETSELRWPRHIPGADIIPALETDWMFCTASPEYRDNRHVCQGLQFKIAAYYLLHGKDAEQKTKGYKLIKDLADHGHPDGMCLYAIILMDGSVPGVDANPEQAIVWFHRCVELHRHIAATYELGIAYYTGEGGVVFPERAVKLFRQAAHLGHAGAAYMLGECLLQGVGCSRDRANALEWLVTSAELGHLLARDRVLVLLKKDHDNIENTSTHEARVEEALKWVSEKALRKAATFERRHTIGASSCVPLSPKITEERKNKVLESRGESRGG